MFKRGRHARPRRMFYRPAVIFGLIMSLLTAGMALGSVSTDQDEYVPGSVVTISGDEMEPGETVTVEVYSPDGSLAQLHEVVADEAGNFTDTSQLPQDGPWGTYTVVATGQSSGAAFTTTFTDDDPASEFTAFSITPTPVAPGGTLSWSASAICKNPNQASTQCQAAGTTADGPVVDNYGIQVQQTLKTGTSCSFTGAIQADNAVTTGGTGTASDSFTAPTTPGTYCYWPRHQGESISETQWATANGEAFVKEVVVQAANTPPVIVFTTTHTTANEGDTKTFVFSITDTATDTHTFVAGYPDCGTGSTLVSPSIDNTTHTGTFQCLFPDGVVPPEVSTVKVKVKDQGNLESNELFQGVTVFNVNPTVDKPSFQSTSVDCRNSATLTGISFSDPGLFDGSWNVNIDWGDGSADTNYNTNTQGAQPNRSHTYDDPGTYTATVTVTDKDTGEGSNTSSNDIVVNQTYTVDFLPPFDDSTPSELIVNRMKNGRVVPVKVTLFDDCGQTTVTDPDTDVTIRLSKTSGTGGTADPVEAYADAGESSAGTDEFRWSSDSFWIYNLDSKALGLVVNNYYRVDVYVGSVKATVDNWAVLQPVK